MTPDVFNPETTMLAATLQRLLADGSLTVSVVSNATEIDGSSVYKWAAGQHEPGFSKIALLFRHCGSEAVQAAILDLITRGTHWRTVQLPPKADIDGDGDVDTDDALAAALAALHELAQLLDEVRQTGGGRAINDAKADAIDGIGNAAIRKILSALRCVAFVHQQQRSRRKARVVATAG